MESTAEGLTAISSTRTGATSTEPEAPVHQRQEARPATPTAVRESIVVVETATSTTRTVATSTEPQATVDPNRTHHAVHHPREAIKLPARVRLRRQRVANPSSARAWQSQLLKTCFCVS